MGVSIYYAATRPTPLSPAERAAVDAIIGRYPLDRLVSDVGADSRRFDGEDFLVYPPGEETEPGTVFEGATGLPLSSEDALWAATRYWCQLLSEVRLALPGANWQVHIDDHDIPWDEERQEFDPSA